LFTDVLQYIYQYAGGNDLISEAFKGALTTGLSFLSPWIDYRDDPVSGDVKFHHDAWNQVILDPFFTKKDLSDCGFVARRKFLTRDDVKSLHPEKEDLINSLPYGSRDDKFTYMPFARQWGMQKLLNYTEYWRARWDTKDVLVDMETGEMKEWSGDKKRLNLFRETYPQLQIIRRPVRSVELGIIVEGQLIYYGKDPNGLNDYPFVPFMAIWEPSYDLYTWKIQSLVRIVRDPQTEINKRRSKMLDIVDSQLNSGWIAKTGAVTNTASLYKSGQGQVIFTRPDANIQTDIQRLQAPDVPASMFQLEAEFEKDIMEIAGVNQELFGMSENDKVETAGILSKMRQAAGLVNLQDIFDGLRESMKILGTKTLKLVQANYTPEKIKLITKKDATPEFYSKQFAKYDIVVEEGVLTDTQRETQFMQYLALKGIGINIPDPLVIKNSNLHDKKELSEFIAQQAQQQAQVEQQQTQMAMEQQAVVTRSLDAKAESDQALATERLAKIQLEGAINAERLQRADEDRTGSVLNLVKAMKELDTMDLDNLARKIEILKNLETPASTSKETKSTRTAVSPGA